MADRKMFRNIFLTVQSFANHELTKPVWQFGYVC